MFGKAVHFLVNLTRVTIRHIHEVAIGIFMELTKVEFAKLMAFFGVVVFCFAIEIFAVSDSPSNLKLKRKVRNVYRRARRKSAHAYARLHRRSH